jgi:beta-glucosidase
VSEPEKLASRFAEEFLFGAATAAYQIEGAVNEDGRGQSIWDTFSHTAGNVVNNDNGDTACDHYHRWESDLDLIQSLGLRAYRFSIAWPRIFPDGTGKVNQAGLAFYDRLIDGCLSRGIQPFATLYHWDLPQALQDNGGWASRATAIAFADYAKVIAAHFGDRLETLVTFNEPWCSAYLGNLYGIHAPGLKDRGVALAAVHHQHLAHGLAIQAIKAEQSALPVGIVLNAQSVYPVSAQDADAAVRHRAFHNGIFFDPLFNGHYPQSVIDACGNLLPDNWQSDLADIHQPLDFWGLNFYTPTRVKDKPAQSESSSFPHTDALEPRPDVEITDIGWEIYPQSLCDLLVELHNTYTLPPCYITENGACFNDDVVDGVVNDQRRIDYLAGHITAVADAVDAGADVRGYFLWSLLDNFEWAEGYTMRFGAVHVDYETQVRTVKQSGHWYANLNRAHGVAS